jgi:hypothetical protein
MYLDVTTKPRETTAVCLAVITDLEELAAINGARSHPAVDLTIDREIRRSVLR